MLLGIGQNNDGCKIQVMMQWYTKITKQIKQKNIILRFNTGK